MVLPWGRAPAPSAAAEYPRLDKTTAFTPQRDGVRRACDFSAEFLAMRATAPATNAAVVCHKESDSSVYGVAVGASTEPGLRFTCTYSCKDTKYTGLISQARSITLPA